MRAMVLPMLCLAIGIGCARTSLLLDQRSTASVSVFRHGFTISYPDEPGIDFVRFEGNCLSATAHLGSFQQQIDRPIDGLWTYHNNVTVLAQGDAIDYGIFISKYKYGFRKDEQRYIVKSIKIKILRIPIY